MNSRNLVFYSNVDWKSRFLHDRLRNGGSNRAIERDAAGIRQQGSNFKIGDSFSQSLQSLVLLAENPIILTHLRLELEETTRLLKKKKKRKRESSLISSPLLRRDKFAA